MIEIATEAPDPTKDMHTALDINFGSCSGVEQDQKEEEENQDETPTPASVEKNICLNFVSLLNSFCFSPFVGLLKGCLGYFNEGKDLSDQALERLSGLPRDNLTFRVSSN